MTAVLSASIEKVTHFCLHFTRGINYKKYFRLREGPRYALRDTERQAVSNVAVYCLLFKSNNSRNRTSTSAVTLIGMRVTPRSVSTVCSLNVICNKFSHS